MFGLETEDKVLEKGNDSGELTLGEVPCTQ